MTMFTHIWKKEIRAELSTWKGMLWLVVSSILFSFTSYLLLTNQELSLLDQTELMWLLGKIIIGVALLIVTIDASSILNVEFEKETAESVFLAPVCLKDILTGKLLAALTLWAAIFVVSVPYIVVTSAGSHLTMAFLSYVALLGTLGAFGVVVLILAISLLYRSTKNTITTSLIILLALAAPALFASNLKTDAVSQAVSAANPIDNIFNSLDYVLVDYKTSLLDNWQFILPLLVFCCAMLVFLRFCSKRFEKEGIIKND